VNISEYAHPNIFGIVIFVDYSPVSTKFTKNGTMPGIIPLLITAFVFLSWLVLCRGGYHGTSSLPVPSLIHVYSARRCFTLSALQGAQEKHGVKVKYKFSSQL
jgi:hypothetical protein